MGPDGTSGEVLEDAAPWGERFVALVGAPDEPGWVAAGELFGAGLDAALARVGAARGTESDAVAGALLLDAYAQRLAAPVLGAYVVDGRVLDARLPQVRTQPFEGTFRRFAFADAPAVVAPGPAAVRQVSAGLVGGHLEPAVEAVHERTRAGRRVLRGAIANAVAITFLHLSWPDPDHARHVDAAREFLALTPGLADLVGIEAVLAGGRPWMYTERNTCCLAFRTRPNQERELSYCATCPVLPRATTRSMFAEATASYAQRQADAQST